MATPEAPEREAKAAAARRRRARSVWQDARPVVVLALAVCALVLGYWGFRIAPATKGGDAFDALYRAVRLFGFSGGDIDPPVPWQLAIARVLAPLLVGYAAISGLAALFREQLLIARLRLRAREHIVIVGLGETGFVLAANLSDEDRQVVVVEKRRDHPSLAGCRQRGIAVIFGDGADPEVLSQAAAQRAAHVFATTGSDATNLQVLAGTAELSHDQGWTNTTVHVLIDELALWGQLRIRQINRDADARLRIEFISLADLTARNLLFDQQLWSAEPADTAIAVLIEATDTTGRRVAVHADRIARSHGRPGARITLVGADAAANLADLQQEAPWVDAGLAGGLPDREPEFDLAFLAGSDDARNLADALVLASDRRVRKPVVALVSRGAMARALKQPALALRHIRPVPARELALSSALLHDTTCEAIARARHERYVALQLERGDTPESNPVICPWESLPEDKKKANRDVADHVATVAKSLGKRIVADDPSQPPATPDPIHPEQLEQLARAEHDRWARERKSLGWTFAKKRDDIALHHPSLVPWEELSEAEREKDRDLPRELPAILASAGYRLADEPVPITPSGATA